MLHNLYNKFADSLRNHGLIRKYPAAKEMIKYSIVGNLNNLLDLGIYIYLTRSYLYWHENYVLANVVGMLVATIGRFVLHKLWTFRDSSHEIEIQFMKFSIASVLGLAANMVVLIILVESFQVNDILAKLIGMIIGSFLVFYLVRIWVFDHRLRR